MKNVLLALLPALALAVTGCQPDEKASAEAARVERTANLQKAVDEKADTVALLWSKIPDKAKQNKKLQRKHATINSSLSYVRKELLKNDLYEVERALKNHWLNDFSYLQKAATAQSDHKTFQGKLQQLKATVQKQCPGNTRALYHLKQAELDLVTAADSGYSVDLLELADAELKFVQKILDEPATKAEERSAVLLRDQLFHFEQSRSTLNARQLKHLEGAVFCVDIHRQAVAGGLWHQFVAGMLEEHLHRGNPLKENTSLCRTDADTVADLFDQIIETGCYIDVNCPGNAEAKKEIARAESLLQAWFRDLITRDGHSDTYQPVADALKSAREAIKRK